MYKFIISFSLFFVILNADTPINIKKKKFYSLLLPPITTVYKELHSTYERVKIDIENGTNIHQREKLKQIYKVKSDKELLIAMKPHSISIALAQAAMESAWGTSRFFTEANNIFGVWSINSSQPRIAAQIKRSNGKTIWLRKFSSLEESVREYYKMLGRSRAYKMFRKYRFESDDVFYIVKGLYNYSEIGEKYTEDLSGIIRYNKLINYD